MTIDKGHSSKARPGGSASPIEFRLDAGSGVPTCLQLVQQVEHALRLGYLKPGDQPPGWEAHTVTLEELVLAYLRAPGGAAELRALELVPNLEPTEVAR